MREVMIVMGRELRGSFQSPVAYVFGSLFLFILCGVGSGRILARGLADMSPFFGLLPVVLLFFVPALTMRLWAEERKQGTLELLMTFPVKIIHLIFGKFCAALGFLAILLGLTMVLPVGLGLFGELDWGPVLANYLATLLMASAYISVGMFWSSVTRDQIIALLISVVMLLVLYFMASESSLGVIRAYVPAGNFRELLILFLTGISPYGYFVSISRGILDTGDLVYYMAFTLFFLHANWMVLYRRRVRG